MSIGTIGGAGLPLALLQAIDELGRELRDESRSVARDEAQRALAKGYEEADNIREQADDMRLGAFVAAGGTLVGAGFQVLGTVGLSNALPANSLCAQQSMARAQSWITLGGTTADLAKNAAELPRAAAKADEADARRAAADAQAASRHAEIERSEATEAQSTMDRARDTYRQMLELEHSSMMAAIGRRS